MDLPVLMAMGELLLPRLLPALLATAFLGLAALAKGSVNGSGALGGFVAGTLFWLLGDWPFWVLLTGFFISSSLLGIPNKARRRRVESKHERGGRRSWHQVFANTGPMLLCSLVLFYLEAQSLTVFDASVGGFHGNAVLAALNIAIVAGFSAAASDTWAGEIGILSKNPPRMLLGWRPVEAGQSGAVSLPGLFGALAGALFLSSLGLLGGIGLWGFVIAAFWGFAASILDSLLGASVQALFQDGKGTWTERSHGTDGKPHTLIRGYRAINNDLVNFLSVLVAGLGALITSLLLL